MATTEHPSGQWSCIPPWETTLLSFQYTDDTKYSVKFVFKRGGQEYIYQTITSVFPNLYYANLKDENMESALEQATFHQAIRILDPAFARMEQPGHVMRMLRMSHTIIDLSMDAAFQNSCEYTKYIDRIYQIPYGNPSKLPLHDWNQFQVIETFKDGFKVQARAGTIADAHSKGEVYGCVLFKDKDLAANGAYLDYLRALDDLRSVAEMNRFDDDNDEEDDEDDGEDRECFEAPRLRAFLRVDNYSTSVVGFVFSWINPWTKASCLRQLLPGDLRNGRGAHLWTLCYQMFQKYHRLGYCITAEGREDNILDVIGITTLGRPFVRLPDLGTFRKISEPAGDGRTQRNFTFSASRSGDTAALQILSSFLLDRNLDSPRSSFVGKSLETSSPDSPRSNSHDYLESLPKELLHMILDYVLLRPSVHCTEKGFCAWPPLDTAVFMASKSLRRSALLRFVRNPFVVEYKFLGTFLRHVAGIKIREDDNFLSNDLVQGDVECWASIQDVTLIVSESISYEGTRHALMMRGLWERSGLALCELLKKRGRDEADLKTKVQIFFSHDPFTTLPYREMPKLLQSFRHFLEFASVEVALPDGEDEWRDHIYGLLRARSDDSD